MKLARPLLIIDLETTGIWVDKDKIIEIGMIKCLPKGVKETYAKRVNPGISIPSRVTEVTGIINADVKSAPLFKEIAPEVAEFIGDDSDLGGFNLERFDLPLLVRELSEAGCKLEWQHRTIYDAQKIYHVHERRDLTAAYKFYCNKDLYAAHSALADTQATLDVLEAQLKEYGQGEEHIEALQDFDYEQNADFFDEEKKFRWWNGELYMLFGKYARKESLKEIAQKDREYLEWILTKDFSDKVKNVIEDVLNGKFLGDKEVS